MDRNAKLNHMLALTEEINVLTQRIKPQATGHIHTTINTLRERVGELKELGKTVLKDPTLFSNSGPILGHNFLVLPFPELGLTITIVSK